MANEKTASISLSASKDGASISTGTITKTYDMTGGDMESWTQVIGTSNEALAFNTTDITGDVDLVVKNLDATNYVEIFNDSGNTHRLSKLSPGQACLLMQVPSASLYGRANTLSCRIQGWISKV